MYLVLQPQVTPDSGYIWKKLSPQLNSPGQPYSLREALSQPSSRRIASEKAMREGLHPLLRQKLVHHLGWEFGLFCS